ncbi:hypothetical protein [Methylorubrum podarium]|nr:hypothetical protein [Methylorubrum podarium]
MRRRLLDCIANIRRQHAGLLHAADGPPPDWAALRRRLRAMPPG